MSLTADDRLEIQEVYSRYAHYYDFGRAEELAGLFTEDGVFYRPGLEPLVGRQAVSDLVSERFQSAPGCSHHMTNLYFDEVENGVVKGHGYAIVLRVAPGDTLRCRNLGWYDDGLLRTDDGWKFSSREFLGWLDPATVDPAFAFEDGKGVVGIPLPS
jgi:SnoaL-like domain